MALYIPHSIFHLARLLCVRPKTFGPYYVLLIVTAELQDATVAYFKNKNPVIRIFCLSGWLSLPINLDKWSSTVHVKSEETTIFSRSQP